MRRAPGAAAGGLDQVVPDRAVGRDLVGHRADGGDLEAALRVDPQLAAQVVAAAVRGRPASTGRWRRSARSRAWPRAAAGPAVSQHLPRSTHDARPALAPIRLAGLSSQGEPAVWKGPSTLPGVASASLASRSTRLDRPMHVGQQRELAAAVAADGRGAVQEGQRGAPFGVASAARPWRRRAGASTSCCTSSRWRASGRPAKLAPAISVMLSRLMSLMRSPGCDSTPMPSISISIVSPAFIHTGGVRA